MKTYNLVWVLLTAISLIACVNTPDGTTEDHEHDESLRLTAYNNDFEVFAEAVPFVVGQQSEILAHFTWLENFKPLKEGKITVSLIVGTEGIRQSIEEPLRDGIFLFSLKPLTMGTGKLIFDIHTSDGHSQLIVPDVKIFDNDHDAQHAAADAVESGSNGILFTKEQSWKVDFATEEARSEPFGQIIRTIAQIQPAPGDEKVIVAKAGGIVSFSGSGIIGGQSVNAGQVLFTIDSGDLADNNLGVRYNEAVSELNRAKADYERKKELAKDRIVSERDLMEAETAFKNAEVNFNHLHRNFSAGKQTVSSSMNGFVKQVMVRNGEYVAAGEPVLVVSQNRDLHIKAEIQPRYFEALGTISAVNFKVLNSNLTYNLEDLKGKIISYGKSVDLQNPLIPLVFQVQNSAGLLPGSFVEMYIHLRTSNQALTVSRESIIEEMGAYFVFVQITPEFFEKRPVVVGKTDGFRTEIMQGLSVSERVVSKGAILVKLAQVSGQLDTHGHAH
jgi:membrane fusion protein, heavy metal efflux system